MDVIFLSPGWPLEMPGYVRALADAGARVHGVGDGPAPPRVPLTSYLRVPNLGDLPTVRASVSRAALESGLIFHAVESLWEPLTTLAAELRGDLGLTGMAPDAVLGFRDKAVMRARVAAAGLRVPRTIRAATRREAWLAAESLGFPIIAKPIAGAGSADTFRCDSPTQFDAAMQRMSAHRELIVEEFVDGPEYTYETLCIAGQPVYESVCRYEPNTLVARQNEWISPIIQSLRHHDAPEVASGIALGRAVISALGMGTGLTHMEWFRGRDGQAIFGEIACRPPGANMVDLMNYSDDGDLYGAWAQAVCYGLAPAHRGGDHRPYSAAIIFKRAEGSGTIRAISGLSAFLSRHGDHVARQDLLPIGAPRRDWRETFLSDGNVVVRHPNADVCAEIAREFAETVHLHAAP